MMIGRPFSSRVWKAFGGIFGSVSRPMRKSQSAPGACSRHIASAAGSTRAATRRKSAARREPACGAGPGAATGPGAVACGTA